MAAISHHSTPLRPGVGDAFDVFLAVLVTDLRECGHDDARQVGRAPGVAIYCPVGNQFPWNPAGTRCGSFTEAMSPNVCASRMANSLQSLAWS